jgi:hypothetical protein
MRVFPYFLPFHLKKDTVWVVAVAHAKRKPEYWISRAGELR